MILVAGGDSFVFGSELKDQINGPSQSVYAALLAKKHQIEYHCAAWSGNANNAISRMTIAACEKLKEENKKIGAIVTWTFANRYEFRFNYDTRQKISPWYSINAWTVVDNLDDIKQEFKSNNNEILRAQQKNILTSRQTGIADFAKTFFKHVGDNEYYELYSSLKEILFLQNYFKTNQIPFLFLAADNYFYQHPNYHRRKDEFIDSLYKQIDWNCWFFFPPGTGPAQTVEPRGFYQWAVENKYPVGTTHPLEEAHQAAAELIKEKFDELVKKPMEQDSIRNKISS
jgi:hypothetical protein